MKAKVLAPRFGVRAQTWAQQPELGVRAQTWAQQPELGVRAQTWAQQPLFAGLWALASPLHAAGVLALLLRKQIAASLLMYRRA
jgi:hypothetical protein